MSNNVNTYYKSLPSYDEVDNDQYMDAQAPLIGATGQHRGHYSKYISSGELGEVLYMERTFAIFEEAVVLRKFQFPTMKAKVIPMSKIQAVEVMKHAFLVTSKSWGLGGRWIAWGAKHDRPFSKNNPQHVIISTTGKWIKFGISPSPGKANEIADLILARAGKIK